ncbi:MAG: hypothetical protein Ct9H300mP1_36990 [Planctomycetaceae bacterium]|nr:MAG: hypothetical protein Ct9H300mP1_36990 [Planctomycetaceae bacterium]
MGPDCAGKIGDEGNFRLGGIARFGAERLEQYGSNVLPHLDVADLCCRRQGRQRVPAARPGGARCSRLPASCDHRSVLEGMEALRAADAGDIQRPGGFDLPGLELAAYRYGNTLPEWFNVQARTYDPARNRYNIQSQST